MELIILVGQQILFLLISLVYVLILYKTGKLILYSVNKKSYTSSFIFNFPLGMMAHFLYNLILSLYGVPTNLIFLIPSVVVVLHLIAFDRQEIVDLYNKIRIAINKIQKWAIYYRTIFFIEITYVLSYSITYFRGADLSIYHLVVPDRILANNKLLENVDSFSAGIPITWHITNIPLYLVGGETSYVAINFWIYLIFLLLIIPKAIQLLGIKNLQKLEPLAINLTGAYLVITLNGSITNTDLPSLFIEICCLLNLFWLIKNNINKSTYWVAFGGIVGYCFSVKFTTAFSILFIYIIVIINKRVKITDKILFLFTSSLIASLWPIYNKIFYNFFVAISFNSSSNLMVSKILSSSIQELQEIYSKWYLLNSANLISGSLIIIPVSALIGLIGCSRIKDSKSYLYFLIFGLLHYLVLVLLIPRPDIIFHDRYHILSYLILVVSSVVTIDQFMRNGSKLLNLYEAALLSTIIFGFVWGNTVKFPTPEKYEIKSPNVILQTYNNFSAIKTRYKDATFPQDKNFIPTNARVATNTIAPFVLRRDYLQLLPFVAQSVNLGDTAIEIACELIKSDTRYLALFPSASTIPGTEGIIEKYLVEVRNLNTVKGVEPISEVVVGVDGKVQSGIFYLNSMKLNCK